MAITQIRGDVQIKANTVSEVELAASVAGVGIGGANGTPLFLEMSELSAVAIDVAADDLAFVDATDGTTKKESIADLITAIAGTGLADTAGVLSVDLNELSDTAIDVSADSFPFIDATDSGSKKESIADLITAIAGDGLGDSAGVLSVNVDDSTIETNADTLRVKALGITNNELALASVDVDNLSDFRVTEGTGLVADIAAGALRNDNTVSIKVAQTETVADDDISFVELDNLGVVSSNITGFTTGRVPIAEVTAASGDITDVADKRAWLDVEIGASGLTESNFTDREVLAFDFDGVDTTGVLSATPIAGTEHVYLNGILQRDLGEDYTLATATITFVAAPVANDLVLVTYRTP